MNGNEGPSELDNLLGKLAGSQLVTSQALVGMLSIVNNNLKEIKALLTPPKEDQPRYVTLPDAGGSFTLPIGMTVIDFHNGTVTLPNGNKINLRLRLKQFGLEKMKSIMFTTSQPLSFGFDGAGLFDLQAGEKIALGDFPFKEIFLQSAVVGSIRLMAAVTPQFTVFHDRYFANDFQDTQGPLNESLYSVDLTIPQMLELDTGTTGKMYIEAFGTSTVPTQYLLETSDDGVHWFTVESETTNAYTFGGGNTKEFIRFTSSAAGVAGNTVSLSLSASR